MKKISENTTVYVDNGKAKVRIENEEKSYDLVRLQREIKDISDMLIKQREKTNKSREAEEDLEGKLSWLGSLLEKIAKYEQMTLALPKSE